MVLEPAPELFFVATFFEGFFVTAEPRYKQQKTIKAIMNHPINNILAAFVVIVAISPRLASAEADKCAGPGPELTNFSPALPPRPSPELPFYDSDDKEMSIADFKGRGVVMNFWATWCGPCQKAMPHYEEIHRKYGSKDVVILGVCGFDTRANYDQWLIENKNKYTFATVFDPVGKPPSGDKEAMRKTIMMQLT
ncbi:MAG: TlpA family protein disulfide reductase, partial [Rhodospirillaceae bacterium]|nr:TlpA family protein disulfide reductase [Rhodospirillaceae bacterium]